MLTVTAASLSGAFICSQYGHFNLSLSSISVNRLAIVTENVTVMGYM